MTKPISKSKRQLAQLLIEAGVTQFPEGAKWAAQDKVNETHDDRVAGFYEGADAPKCTKMSTRMWRCYSPKCRYMVGHSVQLPTLIPNWHNTLLSRDEFDQVVAETVVTSEPELVELTSEDLNRMHDTILESPEQRAKLARVYAPTLDQLLQDWRNADDYAQRKQTEADEAAAMRDERWQAVQARAGEMGVTVGRCESAVAEPEPVITDWSDLLVGDVVEVIGSDNSAWEIFEGKELVVAETGDYEDDLLLKSDNGGEWYTSGNTQWRFIRRP